MTSQFSKIAEKCPKTWLVPGRQGPPADYEEHVKGARLPFLAQERSFCIGLEG